MRYVGGKVRVAPWVAEQLAPFAERNTRYLEPFVGGAAVLARMAPAFDAVEAGDAHEDLILMWRAAAGGWVPPEHVTREEYNALRHAAPSALRGFIGYGASFSGKWFGGYDGRYEGVRNGKPYVYPAASGTASRAIAKDAAAFGHVRFRHRPFDEWQPEPGTLVYCDPPYAATTGYDAVGDFDHGLFWEVAEAWSRAGVDVVVSEYVAPAGWHVLAERTRKGLLRSDGGQHTTRTERLFVLDKELA